MERTEVIAKLREHEDELKRLDGARRGAGGV
jgi:hypothetical protein